MAQNSRESIYYYHVDHLSTPIMLTDANQLIAWDATYEPFGKATITIASVTNNVRFPGQYYDMETGLHYNWNRYYWPEVGRYVAPEFQVIQKQDGTKGLLYYMSIDIFNPGHFPQKLAQPPTMQLYLYALNNPLRYFDVTGLGGRTNCKYYDNLCKNPKGCGKDKYACKAGDCCRDFGESQQENCARNCLIDEDRSCAKLSGLDRWICRWKSHFYCYHQCLPIHKWVSWMTSSSCWSTMMNSAF